MTAHDLAAAGGLRTFDSVDALEAAMRDEKYVADRGLATTLFLTLKLQKPLLLGPVGALAPHSHRHNVLRVRGGTDRASVSVTWVRA